MLSRSIELNFVFLQTHKSASWLAEKMTAKGHSVALLSGEITMEQRLALLNRFRDGKARLLIATNVCARGIDVEQVRHVCKSLRQSRSSFSAIRFKPDSMNWIRPVSRGLVVSMLSRSPALQGQRFRTTLLTFRKSVANQSLTFVSMKHVSVLIIENPLVGRVGQSANERVGFGELREMFWIKLVILPEKGQFCQKQFSLRQSRCVPFAD